MSLVKTFGIALVAILTFFPSVSFADLEETPIIPPLYYECFDESLPGIWGEFFMDFSSNGQASNFFQCILEEQNPSCPDGGLMSLVYPEHIPGFNLDGDPCVVIKRCCYFSE